MNTHEQNIISCAKAKSAKHAIRTVCTAEACTAGLAGLALNQSQARLGAGATTAHWGGWGKGRQGERVSTLVVNEERGVGGTCHPSPWASSRTLRGTAFASWRPTACSAWCAIWHRCKKHPLGQMMSRTPPPKSNTLTTPCMKCSALLSPWDYFRFCLRLFSKMINYKKHIYRADCMKRN